MQREPPVPGEILGARNFAGQSFERPGKPGWSKCHRSRGRFSDLTHGSSSESIVGAHQERKDKRTYLLCSDRDNRFHFCIAFPGRKLNVIYMLVNDLASSWQIFTKMLLCRGWWRRAVSLVVQGRDRCKEKGGMIGEHDRWTTRVKLLQCFLLLRFCFSQAALTVFLYNTTRRVYPVRSMRLRIMVILLMSGIIYINFIVLSNLTTLLYTLPLCSPSYYCYLVDKFF